MSDYEILSMRGRYYAPFIKLVEFSEGKMVIFTDNDSDVESDDNKGNRIAQIKNQKYSI